MNDEAAAPEGRKSALASAWMKSPWMVAVVAALVFLPSLASGFVFDDITLVRDNVFAHSFSRAGRAFMTHFWDTYSMDAERMAVYYRPLVTLSHMVDWTVGSGGAWAFHVTNLLLHGLNCWLGARLARRWVGDARLGIVAALLFALHPTRVPSVVWIAGRSDLLMVAFSFGAVECVQQAVRVKRALGWCLAAAACFVAALLCKEVSVLLALLLAIDAVATQASSRRLVRAAVAVSAAAGLAYVIARALLYPVQPGAPLQLMPRWGLVTVATYLERLVLPWPQTFFYRPLLMEGDGFVYPIGLLVAGGVVVVGYLALLVLALRRDTAALLLLVAALGFMVPLLNFYRTSIPFTTSDHYLYLPLLLLVCGVLRLAKPKIARWAELRAARLGAFGVALTMAAVVVISLSHYRDDRSFWEHELELNPHNPMGLEAMAVMAARQGDTDEAYRLMKSVFAPESRRQVTLATPIMPAAYPRLLELRAALTADGDVGTLRKLFFELGVLHAGRPEAAQARIEGIPEVSEQVRVQASRRPERVRASANRTAELAGLAVRLGEDERARRLLDSLRDEELGWVAAPANLILTRARLGDLTEAARLLEVSQNQPEGTLLEPEVASDLRGRLTVARRMLDQARAAQGMARRTHQALAMATLGAYLRALRAIRPAYDAAPDSQEVAATYVQLLVAARLEREARAVATRALGKEAADRLVSHLNGQLSSRLASLPSPREPSPWWPK